MTNYGSIFHTAGSVDIIKTLLSVYAYVPKSSSINDNFIIVIHAIYVIETSHKERKICLASYKALNISKIQIANSNYCFKYYMEPGLV